MYKRLSEYNGFEIDEYSNLRHKIQDKTYIDVITYRREDKIFFNISSEIIELTDIVSNLFNMSKDEVISNYHRKKTKPTDKSVCVSNIEELKESQKEDIRLMKYLYVYNNNGVLLEKVKIRHRYKRYFEDNNLGIQRMLHVLSGKGKYTEGYYDGKFYSKISLKFKKVG